MYSEYVCILGYPACKAHAPYYIVICGLSASTTFFNNISNNVKIFGGREAIWNTKCVFRFSPQLLSEKFLILRKTQRDIIINVSKYSCKVPVIIVRL